MVVTPLREHENEYSTYTTTNNREHNRKTGYHVSLADSRGIGAKPPVGRLVKVRESVKKDVKKTAPEKPEGTSMGMRLTKLLMRKKCRTAYHGREGQLVLDHPEGQHHPHHKTNRYETYRQIPDKNGASVNCRSTRHLIHSGEPTDYSTENHTAFAQRMPVKDATRFNSYLVRDHCHVQDVSGGSNPDRFTTVLSETMPPRPPIGLNPDDLDLLHATAASAPNADLRTKLGLLSGKRPGFKPSSYSRSVQNVPDPEKGTEGVANPFYFKGKVASHKTRFETEGQQRASLSHSWHVSQTKHNPMANSRRLVKNPPFCRDGVHPTQTELEVLKEKKKKYLD
eukprot:TRINITY_DN1097_c1_g1_i2.p1 TRINITY_DN1097_c1_g1~~TRINITY_DN1097_c1_g1_i2.p1  ORF type:complete len:352 (+),score=47.74 TRINITY_DN1097_c1_g1_i2:41-1057(+)